MLLEKKLAKKRLTKAYNNAKIEYFDNNSKYIFFSDCHRGDSTPSDEFAKNQNMLSECDKVYISSDILLTSKQEKIFEDNNIEVYIIPEYYFKDEIMEVM